MKFWTQINRADGLRLSAVFTAAAVVIAVEIVTFQALNFVREYMFATQVLSVALMGIAVGGILAYFFDRNNSDLGIQIGTSLLPLSVLGCFPVVLRLSDHPIVMMALLALPFVLASLLISLMFNRLKPSLVYLFDLAGAGAGAFIAIFAIPLLREEGSYFLLGLLSTVPAFLMWSLERSRIIRRAAFLVAFLLFLSSAGLLVAHLARDPFNMMLTVETNRDETPLKAFHSLVDKNGKKRFELLHSRGSLIERIDILQRIDRKTGKPKKRYNSIYNGRWVDVVTATMSKKKGLLDFRLPTRLKLGQNPETLLVGPSAQGLTKTVYTLGHGRIDAVEINGAVVGLMENELYKKSGRAYSPLNLTIGDVRTFLERTNRKYDFITLLNTHRIWSMGYRGPPEYCHTKEALGSYFDHLKEDGFVIFEELNTNELADLGIRRFVNTIKATLRDKGVERPSDHLAIWEYWRNCRKTAWELGKCPPNTRMTFIAIKKTPIEQEEYEHLIEWQEALHERSEQRKPKYKSIKWQYLPQAPTDSYWSKLILADDIYSVDGIDESQHDMTPTTDDRPFMFDVFKDRTLHLSMLRDVGLLCLVLVIIPGIVIYTRRGKDARKQGRGAPFSQVVLLILYFAALGIAYLLIEVVLIQRLQIFLSSPTVSLVVVLGTMLISSGIGGYFSGRMNRKAVLGSLLIVVALTLVSYLVYSHFLGALMPLPFAIRVLCAVVMVAVIGFFMGVPFPYGMRLTKQKLSNRHACLFFGINGALGALATPLSILLSSLHGFDFTFMVGGAVYMLCLLLLLATGRTVEENHQGRT